MDRVGSAHSIDMLLGELDDDDGLAELEQELGLNDDAGGSGEYPMTVLHSHPAGGGGFAPPTRGSGGFSSFLSSSPTTSTSSSLSFGRGDGSGVGVADAERGELAIVQHYKSKFSNDALKAQDAADNTVKAVFIIKFDVNEGNVIAWQYPKDIDLSGIEFKAMASGSHNVDSDIVYAHSVPSSIQTLHHLMRDSRYFKVGDLYGVSCYEKRLMRGNVELRGVLMSAVGLLSTNYHNHHHHISFLSDQVHGVNHVPGFDHELLVEYFHNSHQVLDNQTSTSSSSSSSSSPPSPLPSSPLVSRIPHGYFISFLRHFGPHVFSIWKSVLLRQRILFYAPPPVRATCAHVYCANMLAYTRVRQFRWDANPLFYVNINDMKVLHEQETFIAATTEAIFQKKFNIYDVYVAKYKFHMPTKEAELPLRVTDGDRSRYRYLLEIVSTYLDTYKAEQHLIKFFLGLNNRLFEGLLRAHQEGEVVQASDLTERFGLHPSDLTFFSALAGTLNLNFPVAPPKSCLCC